MAGTIQSFVPAAWDARIDTLDPKSLIKIALEGALAVNGNPTAADGTLAFLAAKRVGEDLDFEIQARTTAAETFAVAELIARGVTFPAGTLRIIQAEVYVSGDVATENGYARYVFTVAGATTPVVQSGGVITAAPATMQASGVYQAMAGTGLAATPALTAVAGASTLTINVVSAEAEILNWSVKIKVGKLQNLVLGV